MSIPADVTYRVGDWTVEPQRNRLTCGGVVRSLPPKAMDVLVCLLEHSETVVSVAELIDNAWKGRPVEESSVHQRISQIHRVFENPDTDAAFIENIPRRGHRVTVAVKKSARSHPHANGQGNQRAQQTVAIPSLRNLTPTAELDWLAEVLTEHLRRQIGRWPFRRAPRCAASG